ncbi:MAG: hypothetical protein HQL69_23530 [Magnetococcales bacterium]|nr:hypothetical protein [Magnetococcales bacterium]
MITIIKMLINNRGAYIAFFCAGFACLLFPALATAKNHGEKHIKPDSWSEYPMFVKVAGGRQNKIVGLKNSQADQVTVFSATATKGTSTPYWNSPKSPKGYVIAAKNSIGGYHWIMARHESENLVQVATSVEYFSMPAPPPGKMLMQFKNRLEIIPHPLPREHSHYRASESWPFLIRFHGKPLVGQTVTLKSEQGETLSFTSNEEGIAQVTFPKDLKIAKNSPTKKANRGHGRHRAKANFILTTSYVADNIQYQTTFNSDYRPGPFFNKSLLTGLGFMFLGAVLATPLLKKPKKNRGRS